MVFEFSVGNAGLKVITKNNNSVLGYYGKVKIDYRVITKNNNRRLVYIQNQCKGSEFGRG